MESDSTERRFDEIDLQILERLESDHDLNLSDLSEEIGLSKSAIHYRLNNLKEDGVITAISADLDPQRFGLEMLVITEVYVTHESGYAADTGEAIAATTGVQDVYYTMGDVDFIVIFRAQNRDQINDVIAKLIAIDGVNETSSTFVMDEIKSDGRVLANMSDEMRENVRSD
ncbi:Lrp/AsnC family transcriptional regulator [Halorubrum vacuolatum]|uniref:DNA-binding transcriptional regulator, Lrp family n=1 Tax=Halorubrum vacuolatum TaxID=63740 RepID=A0A238VKR3_HALVU|nr:Lrp/AsnC family transcriptional regulator [Halorubrum vacuolatum]SNR34764.1 DNA-binding transcriptional regulator, Lrp family [Halorubrum vacuolatum]